MRRPPERERGLRSWIRTVILNLAREGRRREAARRRHEHALPSEVREVLDPLETLSRKEVQELLARRLLALSEPYRTTVQMRYYQELSSVEIARRLQVPAGTVRWRLKVGLDLLRSDLDRASSGDRSRWLSSLLLLAGDETAPAEPAVASGSAGSAWPWLIPAVGIGVAGALFFLNTPIAGRSPAPHAVAAAETTPLHSAALGPISEREPALVREIPAVLDLTGAGVEPHPLPGLTVRVVDPAGAAVEGARVLVYSHGAFEERARTDADGTVHLVPHSGDVGALDLCGTGDRVGVRALADGFAASEVRHVSAPFTDGHEVRLVLGGPELVVRGRVLDPESRPVPGATLSWVDIRALVRDPVQSDFSSPFCVTTRSDADGTFELRHIPQGSRALYCSAEGFASEWAVFDGADSMTVRLLHGARVRGVVRGADGRPVPDADVAFEPLYAAPDWAIGVAAFDLLRRGFGERTRTDADGSFELRGVHQGTRQLWATDERTGCVASAQLELDEGEEEVVEPWLEARDGIRLRLVDESGEPLSGWIAQLRRANERGGPWTRRVRADADGRVRVLECISAGACLNVLDPTGLGATYASRRGVRAGREELTVTVDTRAATTLSGTLVDASGKPVTDGQLVAFTRPTGFVSLERDAEGRFEQRLIGGEASLALVFPYSATTLAHFRLAPGETRDLGVVTAPRTGTLRLVNPDPSPGRRFLLHAILDEGRHLDVGNGPLAGERSLALLPGSYRLRFTGPAGVAPTSLLVDVRSDAETVVQPPMQ